MVRWGIIGCGYIAGKMAETIKNNTDSVLYAAASREESRAKSFASSHNIRKYYSDYEALINDGDIDAVYVATINTTHYEIVRNCLHAGKAVLCEKPLTVTAELAEELFAIAREKNVLLMEAMWTRFLPVYGALKRMIDSGMIGDVKEYAVDFSKNFSFDPESRIFNREKGGGALLDLGIYCIHSTFHILGNQAKLLYTAGRRLSTGVDGYAALTLQYSNGATALITSACDMAGPKSATIKGSEGWIVVPHFSSADEFTVYKDSQTPQTQTFRYEDGFSYELEEFQNLLKTGKKFSLMVSPEDTVAAHRIIESAINSICNRNDN